MRYFIGRNKLNNAAISNNTVLVEMKQFDGETAVDKINDLYYNTFDSEKHKFIGEKGIYFLVKDMGYSLNYDPYHELVCKSRNNEICGISIDDTHFFDGKPVYVTNSHKGTVAIETMTWVIPEIDGFARRAIINSQVDNEREMEFCCSIDLMGDYHAEAQRLISRIEYKNKSCFIVFDFGYDFHLEKKDGKLLICLKDSFIVSRKIKKTIYLVSAIGHTEFEALGKIETIKADNGMGLDRTLNWWEAWLNQGKTPNIRDENMEYFRKLSESLLKMCLQYDGRPSYIGFDVYRGGIWIRDGIWISTALAEAGHHKESLEILRAFGKLIRIRPDGNFYFAYCADTGEASEHTYENDSTGLIIYGIWKYYELTGSKEVLAEFLDLMLHCSEWIINNMDNTGLVIPCAGIWEEFGPHLGLDFEHMTWTSCVSQYALARVADMCGFLGLDEKARLYGSKAEKLKQAIIDNCVRESVLCRSLESKMLDSSVMVFFTWMPIFNAADDIYKNTIKAVEDRLVDPVLGGVWRHEEWMHERGDLQPWPGSTLWLAEALWLMGRKEKGTEYFRWVFKNSSYCGMLPECLQTADSGYGITMPSYSHGGLVRLFYKYEDIINSQPLLLSAISGQ